MNIINDLVSYLPVSSEHLKYASMACAGLTLTSFVAAETSPYVKVGSTLATAALWGVTCVKEQQENEAIQRKIATEAFTKMLLTLVEHCVDNEKNVFSSDVRFKMKQMIELIGEDGCHIREGNDDFRAPFVGLQGAIEHVLAAQKTLHAVSCIFAAIHTPAPPTPLCAKVDGTNINALINPSQMQNQDKLTTITEQAISIRRLLAQDNFLLYAIYPKGGLEKRKETEQAIFSEEVRKNTEKLKTFELMGEKMDPASVGALYFFKDNAGNAYAFSIKAQQAISPQENSTWGIWFGPLTSPSIRKRVQEVSEDMIRYNGPNLHQAFVDLCIKSSKQTQ